MEAIDNKFSDRRIISEEEYFSVDGYDILSLSDSILEFNKNKSDQYGDRFIDCTMNEKWSGYEDMDIVITTCFYEDDETFVNRIKYEKEIERKRKRQLAAEERRRLHNEKIEKEIKALEKKLK